MSDPTQPAEGPQPVEIIPRRRRSRPRRLRAARRPELTVAQILAWADDHFERTGDWPSCTGGPVLANRNEKWRNLDVALYQGLRGLPSGSSVAKLLAEHRGARNIQDLPPLTEEQILGWCQAHHGRTGHWPTYYLHEVADAPGESWPAINTALRDGGRGLPGGSSIAQLLAARLGLRNKSSMPGLRLTQILRWADEHHRRTGKWPRVVSGPVQAAPGETWLAVDSALREGLRGLPGRDSLARLLARRRGVRNQLAAPRLTETRILRWADDHHRRTGRWPKQTSGPVLVVEGETWRAIDRSLYVGQRGLPGDDSLAQLLERRRGVRNQATAPRLTEAQILQWSDEHHRETGTWPKQTSGPVLGQPGETWGAIQRSLLAGQRGLPGGDTIAKLLARHRRGS